MEPLVAVDHNQLRTMALETVDPIDWSHIPPSGAVPSELHVLHGVNAAYKSQDLLRQPGLESASTGLPDQRTVPVLPLKKYVRILKFIGLDYNV